MELTGVEVVRVDVPFRLPVGTAVGVHRTRALLFVRVATAQGDGWGECAALTEATSVDPGVDEVARAVVDRGVRRLLHAAAARDGELPAGRDVAQLYGSSPVDRMMAATFEMAVLDGELRRAGRSLADEWDIDADAGAVPVGSAVGIPAGRDLGTLGQAVAAAVGGGASRVRLKIAPGWDVQPVRAVRAAHPHLALQADANGAYRLDGEGDEAAERLGRLEAFGLLCLEQPLAPGDLVAHAELRRRIGVPIGLDESLSSPRRVLDALRNEACDVACLKPGRLGGLAAARRAHAACAAAGVPVFVGGFFEAGLGRAANLALAARLAQDVEGLVGDLGDPAGYLQVDPCGYPAVGGGRVTVPRYPGVGKPPDQVRLRNLGAQRRWFPATYT